MADNIIFKLDIYERRKVIKSFECASYDVMLGTLEDLLEIAEDPQKAKMQPSKILTIIKPVLQEMFPEATREDIRSVKIKDAMQILNTAIAYAMSEIGAGGENEKNA